MTSGSRYKALLLDIEGTTTPISFVTDVLFPYAQAQYAPYISQNWTSPAFQAYKDAFTAEDAALTASPASLIAFVQAKHAKNEKHTAFKSLQGALWQSGYADGSIKSIIYPDVQHHLRTSRDKAEEEEDTSTFIYSSGSIPAQKLLFRYSDQGDLTPFLSGYFDTSTAGPKTSPDSYAKIARTLPQVSAKEWLFLSDNVVEVEAAKQAGMQSLVVERPGNAALTKEDRARHRVITSFEQI